VFALSSPRQWAWLPAIAALTIAAAACSSPASSASGSSSGKSSGSGSGSKHYTIAYVPGATGVAFYDTLVKGMRAEAAKLGMSVIYQGSPDFSPDAQTPVVEGVCSRHPSVLVISPTDPTAMQPAVSTCLNAGIPVITTDTQLSNASELTSAITTDNNQGGTLAADYIGKHLHGSGQIAVLSLSPTATTQVQRVQSFKNRLKAAYPGIKIVTLQYTQQAVTSSQTIARSILLAHPQIRAFYGTAEPNAEGVASALAANGDTGKILDVGFDAGPSEVRLLKKGQINALVAQQAAKEGTLAAQYAYDKLTGHASSIKKSVELPDVLLTTANAASNATYFYSP